MGGTCEPATGLTACSFTAMPVMTTITTVACCSFYYTYHDRFHIHPVPQFGVLLFPTSATDCHPVILMVVLPTHSIFMMSLPIGACPIPPNTDTSLIQDIYL